MRELGWLSESLGFAEALSGSVHSQAVFTAASSWGIKHGAGVGSYYQNTSRFDDLRLFFVLRRAIAFAARGEQTAVGTGSGCVRR